VRFVPPLAMTLLLALAAPAFAQHRNADSHVRALDAGAARVLDRALSWSPTVRRLVDHLEQTDAIVFVRLDESIGPGRAATRFLSAAPGARYVLVSINERNPALELVALLGHELQHATEVADDPEVHSADGMRSLFERIGHRSEGPDTFETSEAVEVGREVLREVHALHPSDSNL
jgi:hypothetical protein